MSREFVTTQTIISRLGFSGKKFDKIRPEIYGIFGATAKKVVSPAVSRYKTIKQKLSGLGGDGLSELDETLTDALEALFADKNSDQNSNEKSVIETLLEDLDNITDKTSTEAKKKVKQIKTLFNNFVNPKIKSVRDRIQNNVAAFDALSNLVGEDGFIVEQDPPIIARNIDTIYNNYLALSRFLQKQKKGSPVYQVGMAWLTQFRDQMPWLLAVLPVAASDQQASQLTRIALHGDDPAGFVRADEATKKTAAVSGISGRRVPKSFVSTIKSTRAAADDSEERKSFVDKYKQEGDAVAREIAVNNTEIDAIQRDKLTTFRSIFRLFTTYSADKKQHDALVIRNNELKLQQKVIGEIGVINQAEIAQAENLQILDSDGPALVNGTLPPGKLPRLVTACSGLYAYPALQSRVNKVIGDLKQSCLENIDALKANPANNQTQLIALQLEFFHQVNDTRNSERLKNYCSRATEVLSTRISDLGQLDANDKNVLGINEESFTDKVRGYLAGFFGFAPQQADGVHDSDAHLKALDEKIVLLANFISALSHESELRSQNSESVQIPLSRLAGTFPSAVSGQSNVDVLKLLQQRLEQYQAMKWLLDPESKKPFTYTDEDTSATKSQKNVELNRAIEEKLAILRAATDKSLQKFAENYPQYQRHFELKAFILRMEDPNFVLDDHEIKFAFDAIVHLQENSTDGMQADLQRLVDRLFKGERSYLRPLLDRLFSEEDDQFLEKKLKMMSNFQMKKLEKIQHNTN